MMNHWIFCCLASMAAICTQSALAKADSACFKAQGMTCLSCVFQIKSTVEALQGVEEVKINLTEEVVTVHFSEKGKKPSKAEITQAISALGYKASEQKCLIDSKPTTPTSE